MSSWFDSEKYISTLESRWQLGVYRNTSLRISTSWISWKYIQCHLEWIGTTSMENVKTGEQKLVNYFINEHIPFPCVKVASHWDGWDAISVYAKSSICVFLCELQLQYKALLQRYQFRHKNCFLYHLVLTNIYRLSINISTPYFTTCIKMHKKSSANKCQYKNIARCLNAFHILWII